MSAPIRALHVLGGLDRGGAETWLVQILERMDRSRVAIDVFSQSEREGAYEERVLATGARVFRSPPPSRPLAYLAKLRGVIGGRSGSAPNQAPGQAPTRYDVVHCHLHHWSGAVLSVARSAGVPVRVAHSRSALFTDAARAGTAMAAYYAAMKPLVRWSMTHGLAVSGLAGESLFGSSWPADPRLALAPSGIDLDEFAIDVDSDMDRVALRCELDLSDDALVVGHVGRFERLKNHPFLADIAIELARLDERAVMVFVGDGSGRADTERKLAEAGVLDRVRFAGLRTDVARLLVGVFDVCVLPSLWEGLPRVANESQAAGKPIVVSNHLAAEVEVVAPLVRRLPLSAGAAAWARALLDCAGDAMPARDATARMRGSGIDIDRGAADLVSLYERALGVAEPGAAGEWGPA